MVVVAAFDVKAEVLAWIPTVVEIGVLVVILVDKMGCMTSTSLPLALPLTVSLPLAMSFSLPLPLSEYSMPLPSPTIEVLPSGEVV
jgi:hypothetical protein